MLTVLEILETQYKSKSWLAKAVDKVSESGYSVTQIATPEVLEELSRVITKLKPLIKFYEKVLQNVRLNNFNHSKVSSNSIREMPNNCVTGSLPDGSDSGEVSDPSRVQRHIGGESGADTSIGKLDEIQNVQNVRTSVDGQRINTTISKTNSITTKFSRLLEKGKKLQLDELTETSNSMLRDLCNQRDRLIGESEEIIRSSEEIARGSEELFELGRTCLGGLAGSISDILNEDSGVNGGEPTVTRAIEQQTIDVEFREV